MFLFTLCTITTKKLNKATSTNILIPLGIACKIQLPLQTLLDSLYQLYDLIFIIELCAMTRAKKAKIFLLNYAKTKKHQHNFLCSIDSQ